ncbi:MAG: hypothetical protein PUA56_01190 [Bacillales bacterium]|nr:hypothetical protein [Bacillales bacterium]
MNWHLFKKNKANQDVIDVEVNNQDDVEIDEEVTFEEDNIYKEMYEKRKQERASYRQKERDNLNKQSKFKKTLDNFESEIQKLANSIKDEVIKGVNSTKKWYNKETSSELTKKLVKILPFMDEEDIHEMVGKICSGDEDFKDLDPVAIMPFLDDDDCDQLFLYQMKKEGEINIEMANFVSEDCLSILVDEYINGKFSNLDIDKLYPFLDGEDVKKLFYFELKKKNKK